MSVEKFRSENDPGRFQDMVRRLLRETILIEEESRVLDLDKANALIVISGTDSASYVEDRENLEAYATTRVAIAVAAGFVVNLPADDQDFPKRRDDWIGALEAFLDSSRRINSLYTIKALNSLGRYFELK